MDQQRPDRTPIPDDDRLRRLEEAVGFGDYTVEQLSEQIRTLASRIDEMGRRIERVESGFFDLAEQVVKDNDPADGQGTGID